MKKTVSKGISHGRVAENRRAKFDYTIIDTIEAGIMLLGSEVKSLRLGRASIAESYATEESGHIVLINSNIPEYSSAASGQNHEPKRIRRLLIHKKERNKVFGQIKKDGCTVVPLSLYFNQKGLAKLSIGIAEGKRKVDKREVIKKRDWDREKHRILKNNN
jgi:SsrA-binding protein